MVQERNDALDGQQRKNAMQSGCIAYAMSVEHGIGMALKLVLSTG